MCEKQYHVGTQNILEQTHDNKTWVLAGTLACGNTPQKVASASFTPAGADLTIAFTPADTAPRQNARFYATNLLCELDQPGEYYFEITNTTMKVQFLAHAPHSLSFLDHLFTSYCCGCVTGAPDSPTRDLLYAN